MKRRLVILGSTGIIGQAALSVVRARPGDWEVVGLACKRGEGIWKDQTNEFQVKNQVVVDEVGEAGMTELVQQLKPDVVVVGVVGTAGILPTLAGLKIGSTVALATKEVLVVSGEIVMKQAMQSRGKLVPIDSEHAAIFMAMHSGQPKEVQNLYITMGKGRLASLSRNELNKVRAEDLWRRKVWPMGKKIGVDSATGMNKAFETIEAHWLFGVSSEQIKIVVHPEYVCHSAVAFNDGSVIAELGSATMDRYVQFGMYYPTRVKTALTDKSWTLFDRSLTFEKPNTELFPAINFGHLALKKGGSTAAYLHGLDRVMVEQYIADRLKFTQISETIKHLLELHKPTPIKDIAQALEAEEMGYKEGLAEIKSL